METLCVVNKEGDKEFDVNVSGVVRADTGEVVMLETKKPYLINLQHVECMTGEWNKDKREYGVRIYFVSGKDVWIGGRVARDLLAKFVEEFGKYDDRKKIVGKFDDRVEAGMPTV